MATDIGLEAAKQAAGGLRPLERLLGVTRQTILNWERIPAERVREIAEKTGLPPHVLRPDLYEGYRRQAA